MRSRDSGTAPFINYYEYCLKKKITCWEDLRPHFNENEYKLLRKSYEDFRDVDLLTGILLERHRQNEIGPIGGCIIAEQFHRLKYGDRYFYSHPTNPHPFTPGKLPFINTIIFGYSLQGEKND